MIHRCVRLGHVQQRNIISIGSPSSDASRIITIAARRSFGSSSSDASTSTSSSNAIIYSGQLAGSVKILKRISVSTLAATWAVVPPFFFLQDASVAAMASLVLTLAVSTSSTAMVQYMCRSYVARIVDLKPAEEQPELVDMETLTWWGSKKNNVIETATLKQLKDRMLVNVSGTTKTGESVEFYIHAEPADGGQFSPRMLMLIARAAGDDALASDSKVQNASVKIDVDAQRRIDDMVRALREKAKK